MNERLSSSRLGKVEAEVAGLKSDVAGIKDDVRNVYNLAGNIDSKISSYAKPQWGTIFAGLGIVGGVITTLGTVVFTFFWILHTKADNDIAAIKARELTAIEIRSKYIERIDSFKSDLIDMRELNQKRYEDLQVLSDREMVHYNSILEKLNEKVTGPKP